MWHFVKIHSNAQNQQTAKTCASKSISLATPDCCSSHYGSSKGVLSSSQDYIELYENFLFHTTVLCISRSSTITMRKKVVITCSRNVPHWTDFFELFSFKLLSWVLFVLTLNICPVSLFTDPWDNQCAVIEMMLPLHLCVRSASLRFIPVF